ncbi:MAG: hypothetical protein QM719_01190 [Thermomonas sp.]
MKNRVVALSIACLLTACATNNRSSDSPANDDIRISIAGEKWSLTETDETGKPVRTLRVQFTDRPGDACIGGNWKRVRVLSDPSRYTKDPVYDFSEDGLQILLINGICDSYDSYFFRKDEPVGQGTHDGYGMSGGETVGHVSAESIK